jgi:hypothetical protein
MCSQDKKHLQKIQTLTTESLSDIDLLKVSFFEPDEFITYLEEEARGSGKEERIKAVRDTCGSGVELSGVSANITATTYHPSAAVVLDGASIQVNGTIIGKNITVNGSGINIHPVN